MNGYRVAGFGPFLRITTPIVLTLLIAADVSSRELVWKPHRTAEEVIRPRRLTIPSAKPLADSETKQASKTSAAANLQTAVVVLEPAVETAASLEPIPVASYRQRSVYGPSPRAQMPPQARSCPPANGRRPQNYVIEPWHPDGLYAASGAGLRVSHRSEVSVLSPEQSDPEVVAPEVVGPEEILLEEIGPGEFFPQDLIDPMDLGGFEGECCNDCGGCPCTCEPDWGYPLPCCGVQCFGFIRPTLEFTTFAIGAEGFKAAPDRGINGNFGFSEAVNLSGSWLGGWVGWQVGGRFIQADFNGFQTFTSSAVNANTTEWRKDSRDQEFLTLGLFHRANECQPWQGGIAIDFMEDHYYYKTDLAQIRLELSRRFWCRLDFGAWVVIAADKETGVEEFRSNTVGGGVMGTATYEAADQYTLFLRWAFPNGGEARIYGGGSNDRDGIIGGNFWSPLSHRFALNGNFGFLSSGKDFSQQPRGAQQHDAYGVSLNIMWYPHCRARLASRSPYRPLFPIANNGIFFVRRS
jgi:hypothetical protein